MITIGLTGSIGMGKSTTASLFAAEGVPVFDADAAVAGMYAPGGEAVELVNAVFPDVTTAGRVDRDALSAHLKDNPQDFARLEAIVHPLVAARRAAFLQQARKDGAWCVLFDIPLLFETGMEGHVDVIVVVSAPEDVQRTRVLARDGMHADKFDMILARQTPDAHKRERADFVIDTSKGVDDARDQVRAVLDALRERPQNPRP
ncbi:dephospho-CoA kinase [Glycocaulis alkaliphilus]|uniref:Dephospho-CoA kinase n=1 Tax=Glycocaulis alkaliphilus TaxID=1434191 RepID=A0A3T0E5W4_9PROT|nr:dephospho-CoA kinase [Glycocaulis alkaliphilus]AZU02616.1 dephospho-CoA kinase [Glycocaulis alkaliphilus]GGB80310.1 dephospho-CoA kinase [Glycocaulis alkaliphilus]